MSPISQADQYLLEQIKSGDSQAWSDLLERYQGRLLAFTHSRLGRKADAEDIVQETFIAFLKSVQNFRAEATLETYLFAILRRKIIDAYRSTRSQTVSLIQDIYKPRDDDKNSDLFGKFSAPDPTASWYVSQSEQKLLQEKALTESLRKLLKKLKDSLKFRDLKIIELLFYSHLANKDAATLVDLDENHIALIKHRFLKQLAHEVARFSLSPDSETTHFENLLTRVWEANRLSCPKRSTIGAYLLRTLETPWQDYVDFHLNKLGCHFCLANLDDLKRQTSKKQNTFCRKLMESTVGFLSKP